MLEWFDDMSVYFERRSTLPARIQTADRIGTRNMPRSRQAKMPSGDGVTTV
jgi:hypothetical protein